jgi:hypothetical protein
MLEEDLIMNNSKPVGADRREQESIQKDMNDREMLLLFLALLSLALPALAIRVAFPDLNPLFLAGLGLMLYGVYLGWFLRANQLLSVVEEAPLETSKVKARPIDQLSAGGNRYE